MRVSQHLTATAALLATAAVLCGPAHAQGVCDPDFVGCTGEWLPVCDTEGGQYSTKCDFERALCSNPTLRFKCDCDDNMECEDRETPEPPTTAPPTTAPVKPSVTTPAPTTTTATKCPAKTFQICGSDGITYKDVYVFATARRANSAILFRSLGACGEPAVSTGTTTTTASGVVDQCAFECPVPNLYEPVCTPTGVVFQNKCTYSSAFCCDMSLPAARVEYCDPLILPAK